MRAAIGQQQGKGDPTGKKDGAKGRGKPALKLVAGKDKGERGAAAAALAASGADQAAGGAGKAAPAAVVMHMPEPAERPSPATMKRIAGTKARAGDTATAQGTLPSADKQVGDARGAVVPPEAERAALAQQQLIAEMNAAPSPEIEKLCERIREVIRNKRPPDEDALASAEPSKEAMEAGNQLNATVKDETGKVQDNYGELNKPPAVPAAPDNPGLAPQPGAAPTALVNAAAATPDAVPPQNVSLEKDAADSKAKIEQAGMEKPAAQLVQSGPIAEAREAQGELNQTAQESPAQVLAKQKETLGAAKADMAALGADALAALSASRTAGVQKAEGKQGNMVQSEDQMRINAGTEAKNAFAAAQTAVEGLLKGLPEKAMAEWDAAKTIFVSEFKADLKIVEDRIKERHSGVGGFVVGLWDAVTGLPGWAEEAYSKAEKRFGDSVIAKIREISTKVNAIILACEKIITDARAKIKGIYDALPASLQAWAAGEQANFQSQLDKLQQQATSTRDNFNKGLVQQAASAVDEVRAEIAELRKKAGGLIGRIAAAVGRFLDDPVKFIIDGLLELVGIPPAAFWALVAKIKKVVSDIADNPEGFANNLLKGLGQGFTQFFDNFGSHLIKGFLTWLLGDLKGVQIPKDLSLKSIATFFLQLMGITWPNIREILARKIGPKNMALIEKAYSILSLLIEKGPEGIYEMIKEKLDPQAIVDQVIEMAVDYMVTAIAKNVAARLLLLFNPVGAIAQAIEAIYRVLKWIFQNAARIFRLIEAVVNGLADIVAGNVGGFANAVEKALGMLIPPVISFIADYCNLGDLPQVVAKQIKSFQKMVLGFVEKAIDWIIDKGKALLAAVGIGGKKEDDKKGATPNEQMANEASAALSEPPDGEVKPYNETRLAKEKQATELCAKFNPILLPQKMKMTITFADPSKDKGDDDLDMTLLIAPNDTKKIPSAPTSGLPPIGGAHRLKRNPPVADDKSESHHVPAKALRKGISAVYKGAAQRLRERKEWKGIPAALVAAKSLEAKGDKVLSLHGTEGMRLSAILLTAKFHDEVHSIDGASDLLDKAGTNPAYDELVFCRRRTETTLKNYIHTNPTTPSWIQFISDVRRQVNGTLTIADRKVARPDPPENVAVAILQDAEAEIPASIAKAEAYIEEVIMAPISSTIDEAIERAYTVSVGLVRSASANKDKAFLNALDPAIEAMRKEFDATWKEQIANV